MIITVLILTLILVVISSIDPYQSQMSDFEQKRRLDKNDMAALLDCRRGATRDYLLTWKQILTVWLIVVISALLVSHEGWILGTLIAMGISLVYGRVAQAGVVKHLTTKFYNKYESKFLGFAEATKKYIKPFRSLFSVRPSDILLGSREELEHLIDNSSDFLTKDEKSTLLASLRFKEKIIRDFMTPKSVVDTIGVGELLGPLVLDGLHKTGHSRFPVVDGDIDHIVGVLHIQNLFALKNRESLTVKEVMDSEVFYVDDESYLDKALAACLKKRISLLIVVNQYRETVGVITLEDIIEELIGKKILDKFDEFDDLRAVAESNPRKNNTPKNATDIA